MRLMKRIAASAPEVEPPDVEGARTELKDQNAN